MIMTGEVSVLQTATHSPTGFSGRKGRDPPSSLIHSPTPSLDLTDTTSHSVSPGGPISDQPHRQQHEAEEASLVDLLRQVSKADDGGDDAGTAVEAAFLRLADLCMHENPNAEENRFHIFALGGHHAIVHEMSKRAGNEVVQTEGCRLLMNMACRHADFSTELGKIEAVEAILVAMARHRGRPHLMRCAVGALGNLVCGVRSNAARLVEAGGVVAIVGAMNADPKNARLVRHGTRALFNLSSWPEYKKQVDYAGANRLCMDAIMNHRGNDRVEKWARKCMAKLREQKS